MIRGSPPAESSALSMPGFITHCAHIMLTVTMSRERTDGSDTYTFTEDASGNRQAGTADIELAMAG